MSGDHTERAIAHVCRPEEKVNFQATTMIDNNAPILLEERRAHDSSWEDNLHEQVRNLDHSHHNHLTSLAGGLKYALTIEGYISHSWMFLGFPSFRQALTSSLALTGSSEQSATWWDDLTGRGTHAALSMFSKNLSSSILTNL